MSKVVIGQEDCLVLNVYVPDNNNKNNYNENNNNNNKNNNNNNNHNNNELLPVMFFIHGGAFFVGSGSKDLFGPERFLDYGVVSYSYLMI
jgi:carboxylesterase type B